MLERGARAALWALLALQVACGPEGTGVSGAGPTESASSPLPNVSSLVPPEVRSDDSSELDGGRGGLEFDPKTGRFLIPEAGLPAPSPLRPDATIPVDDLPREDQTGLVLEVKFKHRAVPSAPKSPEVSAAGIAEAAKATAPTSSVVLTAAGRFRWRFTSPAMPLAFSTELRARFDRTGLIVMWPGGDRYRIIPPGALRTTLGERRVDVTPVVAGTIVARGAGKRFDLPTRTITLESPHGKLKLELAQLSEAGLGGPLFCRALVEVMAIDPATPECKPDEVPVGASYDWQTGGGVEIEVAMLEKRTDLRGGDVMMPPPGAELVRDGLPEVADGVYLSQAELGNLRSKAIDIQRDPAAPIEGFTAENGRDYLMVLWLDGVPVVAVPPLEKRLVLGPVRGRYVAQWRTFLGDHIDEPATVELPGQLRNFTPKPDGADAGPP